MDHASLVAAIAHWLEYERLCGRERLLSEAALKAPLGEFLLSTQDRALEVEVPYPDHMQPTRGRRRSMDFCLQRQGGQQVWTNIVEAKWANGKRDLSQEIFDDLLRLEVVRRAEQNENFERLFLLAGKRAVVEGEVFCRAANGEPGQSRIQLFAGILRQIALPPQTVPVSNAPVGVVEYWREAACAVNEKVLPLTMKIELVAEASAGDFGCWMWRVSSAQKRSTRSFPLEKAQ